jgi:bifunctional DNA-binding transcriptional regulator/antitoxin component of YhaV-PrlF toxin-antitoxin module
VIERIKKLLAPQDESMKRRINSKGQVTIPYALRTRTGLLPHTEVELDFDGETVRVRRARGKTGGRSGARLVAHMRGRGDGIMTTDEIMALTRGRMTSNRNKSPAEPAP